MQEATSNKWWDHWYNVFDESNLESLSKMLDHVQGVAIRGANKKTLALLNEKNIPYIEIRSVSSPLTPTSAHVDDKLIGKIAKKEMDRLDVSHLGFLSYKNVQWSETRGIAYLTDKKDISYLELTEEESRSDEGVRKTVQWLKDAPKPAGIFTSNDNLGLLALISCQIASLTIPDQIAVIGVDNNPQMCHTSTPPLSSIDLHSEDLGRHLAHQFAYQLGIIKSEQLTEAPQIRPPSLVVRESSHTITPHLRHYRKSVEWVYRNALRGPSVEELANSCGISRRALERAFKQNNSPAPAQIIREERMRQITSLLIRDKVTLQHIANQASFPDISSLSNFVKRQTGKTPGDIRSETKTKEL